MTTTDASPALLDVSNLGVEFQTRGGVARRMIRFASEDIGNADPQALVVAVAAQQAFHFIGLPEG